MPCIKESLLIVDDAPSIRMVLSQLLARDGYTTRSEEDGFSALAEIRREVPDLLLSDLNMPGMSGFDLLRVVRRQFPSIRVIAISAFSAEEIPSSVAADAFFQKGRGFGDLFRIIKSLPCRRDGRSSLLLCLRRSGSRDTSATLLERVTLRLNARSAWEPFPRCSTARSTR
jgi:CheY-like chemotaxis protein